MYCIGLLFIARLVSQHALIGRMQQRHETGKSVMVIRFRFEPRHETKPHRTRLGPIWQIGLSLIALRARYVQ